MTETRSDIESLVRNPRYIALVRKRSRFAWGLTSTIMVVYFGFILLVAFAKSFMRSSLAGGATSIGIPLGLGVIIVAIVLTGIYVRRANREFDADLAEILAAHEA